MKERTERCDTPKLFTSTNQCNQAMLQLLDGVGYIARGVTHNVEPGDRELA